MAITNGYATLAEVKASARVSDNIDDALFERAIEGASRRIDGYCGRFFFQSASTAIKQYALDEYNLPVRDIATVAGLILQTDDGATGTFSDTWTLNTDYQVEPLDASLQSRPYLRLVAIGGKTFPIPSVPETPLIRVTAVWGWPAVPHDIREACVIMALRIFQRANAALGVAGFGDMGPIMVRSVDPDVREMLNPYRLHGIA